MNSLLRGMDIQLLQRESHDLGQVATIAKETPVMFMRCGRLVGLNREKGGKYESGFRSACPVMLNQHVLII